MPLNTFDEINTLRTHENGELIQAQRAIMTLIVSRGGVIGLSGTGTRFGSNNVATWFSIFGRLLPRELAHHDFKGASVKPLQPENREHHARKEEPKSIAHHEHRGLSL